jgi:predicted GNAT family N-acyltransferase
VRTPRLQLGNTSATCNQADYFYIKHQFIPLQLSVIKATSPVDLSHVHYVRRKVFVEEQHCPAHLEYANEEESTHFLALVDGKPTGAARWRKTDKGYKLERFAVLKEHRGKQVGTALVKAVLDDLPSKNARVYLNSQLSALAFYERLGFEAVGDQFEEAGIMHQQMHLASSKKT